MPKSACVEPGCPDFAEQRGRCERHSKERAKEARDRTIGRDFYGTKRWRALRRRVLKRDRYTCQECRRFGNEVDHVVPVAQGGARWSEDNLQTLCKSCHSRKTAREVWA
jgi:5-methylcytosine-specific restriction protein A